MLYFSGGVDSNTLRSDLLLALQRDSGRVNSAVSDGREASDGSEPRWNLIRIKNSVALFFLSCALDGIEMAFAFRAAVSSSPCVKAAPVRRQER